DWSSDVCSSDLGGTLGEWVVPQQGQRRSRRLGNGIDTVVHAESQLSGRGGGSGDLGLFHAPITLGHQCDRQYQHSQGDGRRNQECQGYAGGLFVVWWFCLSHRVGIQRRMKGSLSVDALRALF